MTNRSIANKTETRKERGLLCAPAHPACPGCGGINTSCEGRSYRWVAVCRSCGTVFYSNGKMYKAKVIG